MRGSAGTRWVDSAPAAAADAAQVRHRWAAAGGASGWFGGDADHALAEVVAAEKADQRGRRRSSPSTMSWRTLSRPSAIQPASAFSAWRRRT